MKTRSFRSGILWTAGSLISALLLIYLFAFKGGDACNPGLGALLLPLFGLSGFVFAVLSLRMIKYPFYKGMACILWPVLLGLLIVLACSHS